MASEFSGDITAHTPCVICGDPIGQDIAFPSWEEDTGPVVAHAACVRAHPEFVPDAVLADWRGDTEEIR